MEETKTKPVLLCILDGWGHREDKVDNAIRLGHTPHFDHFYQTYPTALLHTSGLSVGLPDGQMGNSEVGHMNIGGGRVVMQDLPRIDDAIARDTLRSNKELQKFITTLKKTGGTCHLMGLLSPGGVHSHQDHMVALAQIIAGAGITISIHAFMDGRDTPPSSGRNYMDKFCAAIAPINGVSIATVSGRYFAMDRDNRWDRVNKAYDALTGVNAVHADTPEVAIDTAYANNKTDEFIPPTIIGSYNGIKDGDGILMANFRADRAREILAACLDPAFDGFKRKPIKVAAASGMVEYSQHLNQFMTALFPAESVDMNLGEVVAKAGCKQLRIAETEKYAHVTFFFNGGSETLFENEDRILVPSPDVATYDLKPEMSAVEVTDKLVEAIQSEKYDMIVVNYANPDMVGHTGILEAAITAVETIDTCLGRLEKAVLDAGGAMLITADHGNVELMRDPNTGGAHTAHTTFRVPAILVSKTTNNILHDGALADLAPTVLALMGLNQPPEMTGKNLIGTE